MADRRAGPEDRSAGHALNAPAWYATEQRFNRYFKWLPKDDQGALELTPRRVRFTGRTRVVDCPDVRAITLVPQVISWPGLVAANLLLVAAISAGLMSTFTWQNPVTIPLLIGTNIFYLGVNFATKWVRVDYVGPTGEEARAYFTDGSNFGWGHVLGGAAKLLAEMKAKVLLD